MGLQALLLVSFTPGLFWLWLFLRQDRLRPEPRRMIAITFGLGCLAVIPAGLVSLVLVPSLRTDVHLESLDSASTAAVMFLIVGPVEETSKFLAVRLFAYRSLYFDEPVDGLVYAAAASLGFASLENFGYVLMAGPGVMLLRAPLTTVSHLVDGSIWGYFLGRTKLPDVRFPWLLWPSLGLAAAVHGLFNLFVLEYGIVGVLVATILTASGAVWAFRRFQWGQRISPFRFRRNYPQVTCTFCGRMGNVSDRFCSGCCAPVVSWNRELNCSHCQTRNAARSRYCVGCGDQLLTRPV